MPYFGSGEFKNHVSECFEMAGAQPKKEKNLRYDITADKLLTRILQTGRTGELWDYNTKETKHWSAGVEFCARR